MISSNAFRAAILGCATMLSGCVSLVPQTKLDMPTASEFRNAGMLNETLEAPRLTVSDAWWEQSDDPLLAKLVSQALTANLDIAVAEARLSEADALVRRAGADRLPGGTVEASTTRQRQSLEGPIGSFARDVPGFQRDLTVFDAAARASWEIDLFGRLGAAARAARASRGEVVALLEGVRIRIAAETADAYVTWVAANEEIGILTAQRDIALQQRQAVQKQVLAGTANRATLDRADSDLARLEASVSRLRTAAEVQHNRLVVLIGGGQLPSPPAKVPTLPELTSLGTPAEVLRSRPDVRVAEEQINQADARIGSALAEYYPSVSIAGLIGFQSIDAAQLATGDALNAQGVLGVRWRLFDFGKIDAEVAAARARSEQALSNYRRTMLLATEDVENRLYETVAKSSQLSSVSRARNAIGSETNDVRRTFEAGLVGLPVKLAAERRLLEVAAEELEARLALVRSRIGLYRATAAPSSRARDQ